MTIFLILAAWFTFGGVAVFMDAYIQGAAMAEWDKDTVWLWLFGLIAFVTWLPRFAYVVGMKRGK